MNVKIEGSRVEGAPSSRDVLSNFLFLFLVCLFVFSLKKCMHFFDVSAQG